MRSDKVIELLSDAPRELDISRVDVDESSITVHGTIETLPIVSPFTIHFKGDGLPVTQTDDGQMDANA